MKNETTASPNAGHASFLRPGTRVYHGSREATVLAVDADPEAHVWIIFVDNPDEDAFVHRAELEQPCWLCERAPGTVDAIDDSTPVRVCRPCFAYHADGAGTD